MTTSSKDFSELEQNCARNFKTRIEETKVKQVIYLGGIANEEMLSQHLSSRKNVEDILTSSKYYLSVLRAGIIVGSGSASFEIIRDLVEKLPVMVAPKWLNTRCQPIAIRNVLEVLVKVINYEATFNKAFDIGGPNILSYREMLIKFAKIRRLSRRIYIVPVMTPKISSYWLYFVTSTSYTLAKHLVDSMKIEVVCKPNNLMQLLDIALIDYDTAIHLAFDKIEQNQVVSSWKDALNSDLLKKGISQYIEVPTNGCFKDIKIKHVINVPATRLDGIMVIGYGSSEDLLTRFLVGSECGEEEKATWKYLREKRWIFGGF